MIVHEPWTVATDAALAVVAGAFALSHARRADLHWTIAFASVAAAACLGAVWHGFQPEMAREHADRLWTATQWAAGGIGFGLVSATWSRVARGRLRVAGVALAAAKFAAYAVWVSDRSDFLPVVVDSGSALIAALAIQLVAWRRLRDPAAPWIAGAAIVSIGAALVQAFGVAPHAAFDHNALYHVLQLPGLWLFHRGAGFAPVGR